MALYSTPRNENIYAGIDVGSMTAKCVLLCTSRIISSFIVPTDSNPKKAGQEVLDLSLRDTGCSPKHIRKIVGTGYGRVSLDLLDDTVTELTCHAKGARFLNPEIQGLIDIGGQDSKAIKLNPNGSIWDFAMNDRCAAGTGRFLETMARALKVDMNAVGDVGRRAEKPCPINSICVVFAESEVISLLAAGESKADIAAGLLESIAKRVGTMAKRIGLKENVAFVGGGAKNIGLQQALERVLGQPFLPISQDPQITGAVGAALIAKEQYEGEQ